MIKEQDILPYAKLRLNIDVANYDEIYLDGFGSAKAEKLDENNPYQQDSIEHFYWSEGWWAGFYEEEPLFSWDAAAAKATPTAVPVAAQAAEPVRIAKPIEDRHSAVKLYWQVFATLFASLVVYEMVDFMI